MFSATLVTGISNLGELGADIGTSNCNSLSIWDAANQGWITASYLSTWDFWTHSDETVGFGQAVMVGELHNFTWLSR